MAKTIAIIPARGGSKRIPKKNIKNFLGKPIIAYSIETALKSNLFDTIMVSTESPEIAEISIKYGAEVPFMRSNKNANDYATTSDVIYEVLTEYEKLNQKFEYACCIYPIAPLIQVKKLKLAYDKLLQGNYDSVYPVQKFSYPIQRALKIEQDKLKMFFPEYLDARSQDLIPAYKDAGQFYWLNVTAFMNKKTILTDNTSYIILKEIESEDIDTEEDWEIAEIKYQILKRKGIL